jgi:hypothetical protein
MLAPRGRVQAWCSPPRNRRTERASGMRSGLEFADGLAMSFTQLSRVLLSAGSLGFGAWGLLQPRGLARAMGDRPDIAPWIGVRDSLIGAALIRYPGPLPLLARVAADASDAVRLRRRSPGVAATALGLVVWGALAAAAIGRKGRR